MKRIFRIARRLREQGGQSMTEFALVLPVLMLVLFAIVQFGIAFKNYVTLTDAVRAGARTGAVSSQSSDPVTAVLQRVDSSAAGLDTSKLQVAVNSTWAAGSDVSVSASYPYSINLLGLVVASGNLTSTTTERVE